MSIAQEDNIIKMNKASIEFLERISGLKYISISEPAHLIKKTFVDYFSSYESEELPDSSKEKILERISTTDASIQEIVEEITEEYSEQDSDEYYVEDIYRDLDSTAKCFDNTWFSDFCSISRIHIAKKKLRKIFEEYTGKEIKPFEIDNIETFGDAIRFLDSNSQPRRIKSVSSESAQSILMILESLSNWKANTILHSPPIPTGEKHNTMPIDNSKVENVIGKDLGHREISVTESQTTKDSEQADFQALADDLRKLEAELLPQLDELGQKIPEIYSGYANIVRETVSTALDIMNFSNKTSSRVAVGAEVFARGLAAFGQWKAAKKHNEMLGRLLTTKKTIAAANISKVNHIIPKARHNSNKSRAIVMKYATKTYPCLPSDTDRLTRASRLMLRNLTIYRTSLFLVELSNYLQKEYTAWMNGKQTTGIELPDYYTINGYISLELFDDKPFEALERCADQDTSLTGAEIMLLTDPQLSLYALDGHLCTIDMDMASPAVKALMENNPGFNFYSDTVEPAIEQVNSSLLYWITGSGLVALIAIILMCIFFIPGSTMFRIFIGISGSVAVYKIVSKSLGKTSISHCMQAEELLSNVENTIAAQCGRIKRDEIDYKEKNATEAMISGFLNS